MISVPDILLTVAALAATVEAWSRAGTLRPDSHRLVWLVCATAASLGYLGSVTLPGGVQIHFALAAWLTLILGYPRAVATMSLVILVHAWRSGQPLAGWGLSVLSGAVAPAWAMWWIVRCCRRWLPPNPFIFFIGCSYFGITVVNTLQALLSLTALALGQSSAAAQAYLPYALLLGFGEAQLEAMITTVMVVYLPPGVVACFAEQFYLRRRDRD